MQYLGGKSKIRKEIASVIRDYREKDQTYVEPFVGGAWVLQEIDGRREASDGNPYLITMYQELQKGWEPPSFISESLYHQYRISPKIDDPLTAFIGFGCSFAGKWFGGYARSSGKPCYAGTTKRSLEKQLPYIKDVSFSHTLFQDISKKDSIIYCDPPYIDTTPYGYFSSFPHEEFWNKVRSWVAEGNTCLISEYQAPNDFVCVREMVSQMGMTVENSRQKRIEKLFIHHTQVL